jgi:enterobacteria phage integrase
VSPRRRSSRKNGWPANLYEENGYFYWRHPKTHKKVGIGRVSRSAAFDQAVEANNYVSGQDKEVRLIDRIRDDSERTVKAWAEKFEKIVAKRGLAPNTLTMYGSWIKRFRTEFGDDRRLAAVTPLMVSEKLEVIEEETPTTAKQLRGLWFDLFREAELAGWIQKNENPVRDTRTRRVGVKRARLTFEAFMKVYASTKVSWLPSAMALALVSGQRRENVVPAQHAEFQADGWHVDQGKTGAKVIIPLELRLDAFGMSLGEVQKMCRSSGVLSHYLVHQTQRHGKSKPGARLKLRRVTDVFSEEVAALGINWGEKTPPTFHEIRSLSKRMYLKQGNVDTKALLGHRTDASAELYGDARGAEWLRVKIGTV